MFSASACLMALKEKRKGVYLCKTDDEAHAAKKAIADLSRTL